MIKSNENELSSNILKYITKQQQQQQTHKGDDFWMIFILGCIQAKESIL